MAMLTGDATGYGLSDGAKPETTCSVRQPTRNKFQAELQPDWVMLMSVSDTTLVPPCQRNQPASTPDQCTYTAFELFFGKIMAYQGVEFNIIVNL